MKIRNFGALLAGFAVVPFTAFGALADCKTNGLSPMYLGKNETYRLLLTTEPDGLCPIFFNAQGNGVSFTSADIAEPPTKGRLAPAGHNDFAYVAPKVAGADAFVLKICGTDAAGTGCNRLEYSVEVK